MTIREKSTKESDMVEKLCGSEACRRKLPRRRIQEEVLVSSMTECEKIVQPSEQVTEWAEVEVQFLVFQAEDLLQFYHPRLQLLEGGPELFDLLVG